MNFSFLIFVGIAFCGGRFADAVAAAVAYAPGADAVAPLGYASDAYRCPGSNETIGACNENATQPCEEFGEEFFCNNATGYCCPLESASSPAPTDPPSTPGMIQTTTEATVEGSTGSGGNVDGVDSTGPGCPLQDALVPVEGCEVESFISDGCPYQRLKCNRCYKPRPKERAIGMEGHLSFRRGDTLEECKMACNYHQNCNSFTYYFKSQSCWLRTMSKVFETSENADTYLAIPCESDTKESQSGEPQLPEVCVNRYEGFSSPNPNILTLNLIPDEEVCVKKCNAHGICRAYSYQNSEKRCHLKNQLSNELVPEEGVPNSGVRDLVSGILKDCESKFTIDVQIKYGYGTVEGIFGVVHKIADGANCVRLCSHEKRCVGVSYWSTSGACVLRSSIPENPMASDEKVDSAIKLSGKFDFYAHKTLMEGPTGVRMIRNETCFDISSCENLCLETESCTGYTQELQECRMYSGEVEIKFDMKDSEDSFSGVIKTSESCWDRREEQRTVDKFEYFIKLVNRVPTEQKCQAACDSTRKCKVYIYFSKSEECWLKRDLESRGLTADKTAVTGIKTECTNDRQSIHFHMIPKEKFNPSVLDVLSASNGDSCWNLCQKNLDCQGYHYMESFLACFLLSEVPNQIFPVMIGSELGIKLNGQYTSYKWRRFEGIQDRMIRYLTDVQHARACGDLCAEETSAYCTAFSHNIHDADCYLYGETTNDDDQWNHGGSISGILRPKDKGWKPVVSPPEESGDASF